MQPIGSTPLGAYQLRPIAALVLPSRSDLRLSHPLLPLDSTRVTSFPRFKAPLQPFLSPRLFSTAPASCAATQSQRGQHVSSPAQPAQPCPTLSPPHTDLSPPMRSSAAVPLRTTHIPVRPKRHPSNAAIAVPSLHLLAINVPSNTATPFGTFPSISYPVGSGHFDHLAAFPAPSATNPRIDNPLPSCAASPAQPCAVHSPHILSFTASPSCSGTSQFPSLTPRYLCSLSALLITCRNHAQQTHCCPSNAGPVRACTTLSPAAFPILSSNVLSKPVLPIHCYPTISYDVLSPAAIHTLSAPTTSCTVECRSVAANAVLPHQARSPPLQRTPVQPLR